MPALEKSLRTKLENTVKAAREVAEAGARSSLEQIGVGDADAPKHLSEEEKNLRRRLRIHGRQLGDEPGQKKGAQTIERLVEEVAYEHWHRLLFASFLAENKLLMYPDPDEPVAVTISECDDMAPDEGAQNGWELAARYAARMLPQIFRIDSPVFELELPPESHQQLQKFVANLPSAVFQASDSLGWVYQFWQANRKEAINKSEVKIGSRELPAVTQLFTENYMVDFLLDNTLGAWHASRLFKANPKLACDAKDEHELRQRVSISGCDWPYLRFTKGQDEVWSTAAGTFEGWPCSAEQLKCLDPCMGSGHFIVAMFERLIALRAFDENLSIETAVMAVIRDNLFGLEIDARCTQIAAFNLALAAWRLVGYCLLPPMNLACSGLAPNADEGAWKELAGENERLRSGINGLYDLFEQAPVLGSLINPQAGKGDLITAHFSELRPLLEKALTQEVENDSMHEMAVTAKGLAKAADILSLPFQLVVTNVPFLGRPDQVEALRDYCETHYGDAQNDLATCFVLRCLEFLDSDSCIGLVTPQSWFNQSGYIDLRRRILRSQTMQLVGRLGPRAFETITGERVNVCLSVIGNTKPTKNSAVASIVADPPKTPSEKAELLRVGEVVRISQFEHLDRPDSVVVFGQLSRDAYLSEYAYTAQGFATSDNPPFIRMFWELLNISDDWTWAMSAPSSFTEFGGRSEVLFWQDGQGDYYRHAMALKREGRLGGWKSGAEAWSRKGVLVSEMGQMAATLYTGEMFDHTAHALIPRQIEDLLPIWAYASSPRFRETIREISQKLNITNETLVKVPFNRDFWARIAKEKYPTGVPEPFSSDPTQWLFNGNPFGSNRILQVAVARLAGYRWPRQTGSSFPDCPALDADGLEAHADKDGIVCIPPVRGEASAADRLLNLLAAAYGPEWNGDVLNRLLAEAGYAGKSLETWLRDGFFNEHLEVFHKRPFVWHIWDGLRDGFSALVNYHKLDHKNLETLIYTYLGDWISRCESEDKTKGLNEDGEKTTAAKNLKRKLELILEGQAPYDIFVRWKPLHQQPIGWNPAINDGVRMNIRPFVSVPDVKAKDAGVLRANPKIKWEKDRGKEPERSKKDYPWFWGWDEKTTDFTGGPEFKGERFNNCHYTLAAKQRARESSK